MAIDDKQPADKQLENFKKTVKVIIIMIVLYIARIILFICLFRLVHMYDLYDEKNKFYYELQVFVFNLFTSLRLTQYGDDVFAI